MGSVFSNTYVMKTCNVLFSSDYSKMSIINIFVFKRKGMSSNSQN